MSAPAESPNKRVVLVTGASRGIGRGIAVELGKTGAIVYVTGRKPEKSDNPNVPTAISLEDVAKEVTQRGGKGHAVYCDHSNPDDIKHLFEQIDREQNGRLDVLVNNAYSGVNFLMSHMGKKFFEYDEPPEFVFDVSNGAGLRGAYIAAFYASKLMIARKSGVIVNIGSKGGINHMLDVAYGVGKAALDKMSADLAYELHPRGVTVFSLWPGAVSTEIIQGANLTSQSSNVRVMYQSIYFAGKILVQLLADPRLHSRTGRILTTNELGAEFGVTDEDGTTPRDSKIDEHLDFIAALNKVRCQPMNTKQLP